MALKQRFSPFLLPGLFWASSLLIYIGSLSTKIFDPDMWWHLAYGRELLSQKHFVHMDMSSHTIFGSPWLNFEWGYQVFLTLFHFLLGVSGLYYLKIFLGLFCIAGLVLCLRQVGVKGPWLLLLTWGGFLLLRPRLMMRPELFTFLFLAAFLWFLLEVRRGVGTMRRHVPWILFGLMVLWVNIHGGFIYGMGMVALVFLGSLLSGETGECKKIYLRSLLLVFLALFLNRVGYKIIFVFTEHLFQINQGPSVIQEWQAAGIRDLPLFWSLFVLCGGLVSWVVLKRKQALKFWIPAVLVFSLWGSVSYRNTALFAFVAIPFLAEVLETLNRKNGLLLKRKFLILAWVGCALPILAQANQIVKSRPNAPVAWSRFPVQACRFVEANHIRGKMFNSYGFGGYIQWALGGNQKVFMDGRYPFYPLLKEFNDHVQSLHADFRQNPFPSFLNKHHVDYAIVNYSYGDQFLNRPGANYSQSIYNFMFPREKWALVFWDDAALVFLKRKPPFAPLIQKYEYSYLWPYNVAQMEAYLKENRLSFSLIREDLAKHEILIPQCVLRIYLEDWLRKEELIDSAVRIAG